jgi:glycine/D-amino acid oxidase-like deaminating enzyme
LKSTQTDILVVGGGIVGTLLAYFLANAGREVLLVEEFDLGTLASGSNAGSLHAQIPHEPFVLEGEGWARGFAPVIPLMVESIGLWQELARQFDVDLEILLGGGLLVAETQAQMRDVKRKVALERAHGLHVELLDARELQAIAPYLSDRMIGGAFCPQEGKINPLLAMPAIARAAEAAGVTLWRHTRLEGLKTEAHGFMAATSRGEIAARRVVNCAGARRARPGPGGFMSGS